MQAHNAIRGQSSGAAKAILRELLPAIGAASSSPHPLTEASCDLPRGDGEINDVDSSNGAEESAAHLPENNTVSSSNRGMTSISSSNAASAASIDAHAGSKRGNRGAACTPAPDALSVLAITQQQQQQQQQRRHRAALRVSVSSLERSLPPPSAMLPEFLPRALAVYTALRSFSKSIRLAPFGPGAFYSSVMANRPSPPYDEVHLALLRVIARTAILER